MSELKSCPFCGGENVRLITEAPECFVVCEECDISANTEKFAIINWNNRPIEDNLQAQLQERSEQLKASQDDVRELSKANSLLREVLKDCLSTIEFRNIKDRVGGLPAVIRQALNKEGSVSGNASLEEV